MEKALATAKVAVVSAVLGNMKDHHVIVNLKEPGFRTL